MIKTLLLTLVLSMLVGCGASKPEPKTPEQAKANKCEDVDFLYKKLLADRPDQKEQIDTWRLGEMSTLKCQGVEELPGYKTDEEIVAERKEEAAIKSRRSSCESYKKFYDTSMQMGEREQAEGHKEYAEKEWQCSTLPPAEQKERTGPKTVGFFD